MGDEKVENVELATARKPHKKGNGRDSETIGSSPTALVSDKQNSGYNGSWQPVTQRVYRCKKAVISAPPSQAFGSRTPQQRSEDPWRRPLGFTWQNLSEWPWIQMDPRLHGQIILDDSRFQLFPTFHSQILLISFGPCQPLKIPPTFQLRLLARETRLATQIQGWKLSKSWRCHLGFNSWNIVGWFNLQNDSTCVVV